MFLSRTANRSWMRFSLRRLDATSGPWNAEFYAYGGDRDWEDARGFISAVILQHLQRLSTGNRYG